MVKPETWKGYQYDEKNNKNYVNTVEAYDANKDIDPEKVKAKTEEIRGLLKKGSSSIKKEVSKVIDDEEKAMIVKGAGVKKRIDEFSEMADSNINKMLNNLDSIDAKCQKCHDDLQKKYNEDAKNSAESGNDGADKV